MSPQARRLRRVVLTGMGVLIIAAVGIVTWIGPEQGETKILVQYDGVVAGTAPPLGMFTVINQGQTSVRVYGIIIHSLEPEKGLRFLPPRWIPWQALRAGKTNHLRAEIPSPPSRCQVEIHYFVLTPRRELFTRLAEWTSGRRLPEFIRRQLEMEIPGENTQIDFQAWPRSSNAP